MEGQLFNSYYNITSLMMMMIALWAFYNGQYVNSKTISEDRSANLSKIPLSSLKIINLRNISTDDDQFVTIDSNILSFDHSQLDSDSIVYLITQVPKYGVIMFASNENDTQTQPKNQLKINESILMFTQKDINDRVIQYKYTHYDPESKHTSYIIDMLTFDVTDGFATLRDFTVYINITSKIIRLITWNITVTEGHSIAFIPDDFIVSSDYYANMIDEFIIIEEPKFGTITVTNPDESKEYAKHFTMNQIRKGLVAYEHDSSETTRDWLTVVAKVSELDKESLPSTIHIIIEPINDETPHVVNNTGLELWEGMSKVITNTHLAAADDDSITEDILFEISTPSNGYVTFVSNRRTHIDRFTQKQLDYGQIMFVHTGDLAGGFRFQVNDGVNFDSPHVFAVVAKPVIISLITNERLHLFPGMQQSVTRDHLLAMTNDGNSTRKFTYQVLKEPKYGRILLELSDGSTITTLTFTQQQIDQKLILYEQNKPLNGVITNEEILLDIESEYVRTLRGAKFIVEISIGNYGEDVSKEISTLITVHPINVTEGKFVIIDENTIDVMKLINKWQSRQYKGFTSKLTLKFNQNPTHGLVLYDGENISTKLKSVPLSALNKRVLIYQHDDSNTLNDTIHFGIYLNNGIDIPLLNQSLTVFITPVNDEIPILLTHNPRISLIEGSKKLITNAILNTRDDDGLPEDIIYDVVSDPYDFGYFMLEPYEESPLMSFSQKQIDSNQIYFKHNGIVVPQQIKLRIRDGQLPCPDVTSGYSTDVHCLNVFPFTILVHQLTLKLFNHSAVSLMQGLTKTLILQKNLGTISNDGSAGKIFYTIQEFPKYGVILINERKSERFTQNDINSLAVCYVQINKTSKDHFSVDIASSNYERGEKSIHNVTVQILVKPFIRARKPYVVASPGQKTVITLDYIDAGELAFKTNSIPRFLLISNPRYGYLKKFYEKKTAANKRINKRKSSVNGSNKSLAEFTHEDIMKSRIAYIANDDLDLTYPNEILTDIVNYELTADNVQPALGNLVINIVNHRLIPISHYEITKEINNKNISIDVDTNNNNNNEIGIFQSPHINYLSIIITRNHLMIAFIFLIVFLSTIVSVIIIKMRHSSREHITTNHKSSSIKEQLNPSAQTYPPQSGIDFTSETVMMTNRFSPRSTPSVSEIETGYGRGPEGGVPLAPPTSPTLSTNCSLLEIRSRTETPRSLPGTIMHDNPRGGCSGYEETYEPTNSPYFPLPPPSLYFGPDSSIASRASIWGTNSLCKLSPQCLEDHCYNNHRHMHHMNRHLSDVPNEFSTRPLGSAGTSCIGSPIATIRRMPWSAEDLCGASAHTQSSQNCRNCLTNNSHFFNSNNNSFEDDHYNQMSQNIKHQYWV